MENYILKEEAKGYIVIDVDTSQVVEATKKAKKLLKLLKKANSLADELASKEILLNIDVQSKWLERRKKVYEMSEEYKQQYPTLDIKKDGATYHLYLNGVELKTVTSFNLQVNAGEAAQLTLTMDVL